MKIAIPTHRRSDKIKELTLNCLKDVQNEIYIFISDEEDYEKYKKVLPTYNLILCNTKTVYEKFNFIQNYFEEGEHVMVIEDDIKEIKNLYKWNTPDLIRYIQNYCIENNIKAWGVYPSSNEFFMKKTIDTGRTYIVANLYGFVSKKDERLLCTLPTKNDYERSMNFFKVYKKIERFNFISCVTKNYTNKGGMQTQTSRNEDEYLASLKLIELYPSIFKLNENRKSKYTELKMKKVVTKKIMSEESPEKEIKGIIK